MSKPLRSPTMLSPLLKADRFGLLTDFDGTIAPIAIRPEDAIVSAPSQSALAALVERLPLVGVISGRALFDLRAKLNVTGLVYIGSHGLVWWYEGVDELPDDALPYVALAEQAMSEFGPMRAIPWLQVEQKGVGVAFHYRLAADPVAARTIILTAIADAPVAQHFEIREGIYVVELYPRLHVDKGTAVHEVVRRFSLDGLLYLGDDLTDIDAMHAVTDLRTKSATNVASIAVRHPDAPAIVADAADWTVDGVAEVDRVLEWLVEQTEGRTPSVTKSERRPARSIHLAGHPIERSMPACQ